MNSWLEEAEKRENLKTAKITNENLINRKVFQANAELIREFINSLIDLVDRVNKIPLSIRHPNNEIGYTKYEIENKYEFYGSASYTKIKKYLFIKTVKNNYIIWRRMFFEVSQKENKVKININEKYISILNSQDFRRYKDKYLVSITRLDQNIQDRIIDWLIFRISNKEFVSHLPLHKNGENKINN